jgi:DNA-binding NarL/FixJ family response regulator
MTVEDYPKFRDDFEILVSFQEDMDLAAQAENAEEAIHEYRRLRTDIVHETTAATQFNKNLSVSAFRYQT